MRGGPSREKCEINFCDVERPKGKAKLRQGRPNTLFFTLCVTSGLVFLISHLMHISLPDSTPSKITTKQLFSDNHNPRYDQGFQIKTLIRSLMNGFYGHHSLNTRNVKLETFLVGGSTRIFFKNRYFTEQFQRLTENVFLEHTMIFV